MFYIVKMKWFFKMTLLQKILKCIELIAEVNEQEIPPKIILSLWFWLIIIGKLSLLLTSFLRLFWLRL